MASAVVNAPRKLIYKSKPSWTEEIPNRSISIPGFNRLTSSSFGYITKLFWVVTTLVCIITCLYLTVTQLQYYFSYPTSSKMSIDRRQNVKLPPFSLCVHNNYCYDKMIMQDIKTAHGNHSVDHKNLSFQDLNVNLDQICDQCHFNVGIKRPLLSIFDLHELECVITHRHTIFGSCAIVRQIEPKDYSKMKIGLITSVKMKDADPLFFILHGEQESVVNGFEIFIHHELEKIFLDSKTKLKIQEQVFHRQNITGRECYGRDVERNRINQYVLNKMTTHFCRLPYFPQNYPECQTLRHFTESNKRATSAFKTLLRDENLHRRRFCKHVAYSISVDYVLPLTAALNNTAELKIRFSDDTILHVHEYFSYPFSALISDLFAYWGFFTCVSALVLAEIIEILIHKLYLWFKYY